VSDVDNASEKHLDEITLLLYVERQLERDAAHEVSLHTQTCTRCLTLLRALDRESRLLTRSMVEEDEPFPARLAEFRDRAKKPMQWIWGVVFGLAALGVYALYSGYIEPWQTQLEQAGFGGSNLVSLLVFQGAFWKGWQSVVGLVEFVAFASLAGFGIFAIRRYLRRGAALAVMFASLGLVVGFANPASAAEFRKDKTVEIGKDQVIKSDLFLMADHIRMDGTVEGDVYAFAEQAEISGHVEGDVFCFCQSLRVGGEIDGNIRDLANNITITGTVKRSVTSFTELFNLDPNGTIGRSLTGFSKSMGLDGKVGMDLLAFAGETNLNGSVGGSVNVRGESLSIGSGASIGGTAQFKGDKVPEVASGAKLASPLQYTKWEHNRSGAQRGIGYYVWRVIWAAAYILFGLVLLSLMPLFSREATQNVENVGASFGLGALVTFAVPFVAIIACVTVVGLFVGLSTLFLWYGALYFAQIIVGTAVGIWILGRANDTWGLIGRMAVGVLILRACMALPYLGVWIKWAIVLWGVGALSLAIYRRLQPVVAPNIPSPPLPPTTPPLPPNTTVAGAV
jgi:cytoskeletal protein CcmA (bactofilin family)